MAFLFDITADFLYTRYLFVSLVLLVAATRLMAQSKYSRNPLRIMVVPGISTSSAEPELDINAFSFNIFSGYSYATTALELALINNVNTNSTSGIQLSLIANTTGTNYELFDGESEAKASLKGWQVSSVNLVKGDVKGAQTSIVLNQANEVDGVQFSGIANVAKGQSTGMQVSSVFNYSESTSIGFFASMFNYSGGRLTGIQLGAFNRAQNIEGQKSEAGRKYPGIQIGLINRSKENMHGSQVGLVNIAGDMFGNQLGFININSGTLPKDKKSGRTLGVFNLGHFVGLRAFASNHYVGNLQFATGMFRNHYDKQRRFSKYLAGAWTVSYDHDEQSEWAIAWELAQYWYKYDMRPQAFSYYHKLGLGLSVPISEEMNVQYIPNYEIGIKLMRQLGMYLSLSAGAANYWEDGNYQLDAVYSAGITLH